MSDSRRIAPQVPSLIPSNQPPESSQQPSWFTVVKDAFNPTALLFGGSPKQPESVKPILQIIPEVVEPGDPLCQITQDVFKNMGPMDIPKKKATPPEKAAQAPPILDIPHPTTTPASLIAAIPEQEASPPTEPAQPPPILDIPHPTTTPTTELANIAEEDPDAYKRASTEPTQAPPLPQANTTLDVANRVATKVGAVATVTGTLAKGVDLLPGGAGIKQKAMGKIHALYQGIKFPSLSFGKVYQGTKALYQMASSIKSSELIGAAIVCGGLYWWFKRPRRSHQSSSRNQAPIVNVHVTVQSPSPTIHNTNTVHAPIHVQTPPPIDKPGDVK